MNSAARLVPVSFGAGLLAGAGLVAAYMFADEITGWLPGLTADTVRWTSYPLALALLAGGVMFLVLPERKGRTRISGVDDLASRIPSPFPFGEHYIHDQVQDIDEWLVAKVGVASIGSDDAVLHALRAELHPWKGTGAEIGMQGHLLILLALFSMRATEGDETYYRFRDFVSNSASVWKRRATAPSFLVADGWKGVLPLQSTQMLKDGTAARVWLDRHAGANGTVETVLMAVLAAARANAELPETDFPWLAEVDPGLARALNAVGRPSFLPGSLGAASHFAAEMKAGEAIVVPDVDAALRAIRRDLKEREETMRTMNAMSRMEQINW